MWPLFSLVVARHITPHNAVDECFKKHNNLGGGKHFSFFKTPIVVFKFFPVIRDQYPEGTHQVS
jgi:hypothetical protein